MYCMNRFAATAKIKSKEYLEVGGANFLSGEVEISGAKNSALVLMAASLLTNEALVIKNIPNLTDINVMSDLLASIGVEIEKTPKVFKLKADKLSKKKLKYDLVHALRASFFCIGPLLARFGSVEIPLPGGCEIGSRPVNEHIKALEALGANIFIEQGVVIAKLKGSQKKLKGSHIQFNCQSVGATETLLMASTLAEGKTILENAAQEPEVQDLVDLLNSMGARITGGGTKTIVIQGVNKLNGCEHTVIPDRIEAGTFLVAAAITRSPLFIHPVIPEHLRIVLEKLRDCGCLIETSNNSIKIIPSKEINSVDITTAPYPGFPTDLQAPFMALMTTAKGTSRITETIFEKRMQHVIELNKMGSSIILEGSNIAFVKGVKDLTGTYLTAGDLRSSAAMVLASLSAKGISRIQGLNYLDRGYEKMEEKLRKIGANIVRSQLLGSHFEEKSNSEIKTIIPHNKEQEVA